MIKLSICVNERSRFLKVYDVSGFWLQPIKEHYTSMYYKMLKYIEFVYKISIAVYSNITIIRSVITLPFEIGDLSLNTRKFWI